MTNTTILLFCLSFIAGVLYYYFRMAKKTQPELVEENSIPSGTMYTIKSFFGWAEPVGSVQEFQEWGTNVDLPRVPRKDFKKWMESLELPEAVKLTQQVSAFSSGLNIELGWLTSEQLNNHPQLKQAVSSTILFIMVIGWSAIPEIIIPLWFIDWTRFLKEVSHSKLLDPFFQLNIQSMVLFLLF